MDGLVLRGDVVTFQDITYQIQEKLDVDIHEAVDIVYEAMLKREDAMNYWRLPHEGVPVKLDHGEYSRHDFSSSFFNSRWWDTQWRAKLQTSSESFGTTDPDMENIEGLAILRSDVPKYFPFLQGAFITQKIAIEVDPSDLPAELDAANMAFRAVRNGYGDQSATARNRIVGYLEKHYSEFTPEQVKRIATVANPDKSTGRKKRVKE